uniref:Methyltransferase n=1 Tax=Syphacia muris TaxID=451379 RepID=A0A0N5AZI1_9BILA
MEAKRRGHKSHDTDDPILKYIVEVSVKKNELLEKMIKKTLAESPRGGMVSSADSLQLGQNLIQLIQAKNVVEVGTFTGVSAVAWALALPSDGKVTTIDIAHDSLNNITKSMIDSEPKVASKIKFLLAPATQVLESVCQEKQPDFIYIDADKENYLNYYETGVKYLRPGGIIMVDNALWHGEVANITAKSDESAVAIDKMNRRAGEDDRVNSVLLNIADGVLLVFKKH